MENKNQHNSCRTRTPIKVESYSKEEKNTHEEVTLAIKGRDGINQRHTKAREKTVHMERKEAKMQNHGSSTKSKAGQKKEKDAWIKENIIVTFHKWSEDEEKKLKEKFGSLGIKEETRTNDSKEKKKNVFLWDSDSEENDDYLDPREENFPTHSLHIKYSGFDDIEDFEEILTLEGGQITNIRTPEEGEEDAHIKSEPSAP